MDLFFHPSHLLFLLNPLFSHALDRRPSPRLRMEKYLPMTCSLELDHHPSKKLLLILVISFRGSDHPLFLQLSMESRRRITLLL